MKKINRLARHKSLRKNIKGDDNRPRLAVYKSTQHIYAQIIDDIKGVTIAAESDLKLDKGTKSEKAIIVGENLAKKALKAKVTKVVFDRGGFKFHGRIAAVASGARKGGLEF